MLPSQTTLLFLEQSYLMNFKSYGSCTLQRSLMVLVGTHKIWFKVEETFSEHLVTLHYVNSSMQVCLRLTSVTRVLETAIYVPN